MKIRQLSRSLTAAVFTSFSIISGCENSGSPDLTPAREAEIVTQLKTRLEDYANAVVRWDREAMDEFWGDSDQFVMAAGDGTILGGHAEWSEALDDTQARLGQFLSYEYANVHIAALGPNAASATADFDYRLVWATGDTLRTRGVWTYVFQWDGAAWDVIHSNGTHIEF